MGTPDFIEIRDAVRREVLLGTNSYTLLTKLLQPMLKQRLLVEHYPYLVLGLTDNFAAQVLMTVCRLYDPDKDVRHASLSNFLRRVPGEHANDIGLPASKIVERSDYEYRIPQFLDAIRKRWPTLAQHRSGYLAHHDVTKTALLPPMAYHDAGEGIEEAKQIVGDYIAAYEDRTQIFEVAALEWDCERFLTWCRLDDYQRHFNQQFPN